MTIAIRNSLTAPMAATLQHIKNGNTDEAKHDKRTIAALRKRGLVTDIGGGHLRVQDTNPNAASDGTRQPTKDTMPDDTKPAKKPKEKKQKPTPECACGCGEKTKGGTFKMGHDAKMVSRLMHDDQLTFAQAKKQVHDLVK